MTTPVKYYPTGPIRPGEDIVLSMVINRTLYVAIYSDGNVSFVPFIVDAQMNSLITSETLLVLKVDGTVGDFTATVKSPASIVNQFLNITSTTTPNILSISTVSRTFNLASDYSAPPFGYTLFSTVNYKFMVGTSNVSVNYVTNNTSTTTSTTIYTIAAAYHESTSDNVASMTCTSGNENPTGALMLFNCSILGSCTGLTRSVAWTRVNDCRRALNYNYCKAGQLCGECLGPCTATDSGCNYNSPNSAHHQNGNTEPFICSSAPRVQAPTPTHQQGWFVTIIVILVIIAVLVAIYVLYHRERNTVNHTKVIQHRVTHNNQSFPVHNPITT